MGPTLTNSFVFVNVQLNLLVRGMGRAVPDGMAKVVVFLNGAPVIVGIGGMPVPVPLRPLARMVMGSRRRARTERMKCCIFELMVDWKWEGRVREMAEGWRYDWCLGGKGKECKCIDSQSEWTGAFVDGQNGGLVERSLGSEVKKEKVEGR